MKIIPMYIYRQTNSGGTFFSTDNTYVENSIYPVKILEGFDDGLYVNIAVLDDKIIPKMIYFDGVEKGRDCACCGDRWYELDGDPPAQVHIFKDHLEFEKYKNSLSIYTIYCILADFK